MPAVDVSSPCDTTHRHNASPVTRPRPRVDPAARLGASRRSRGGRSQLAASFQVLPRTTTWAAGQLCTVYTFASRQGYSHTRFFEGRGNVCGERAGDNLDTGSDIVGCRRPVLE